jgi:CxxC motif-containing protein (DUF1111 family)
MGRVASALLALAAAGAMTACDDLFTAAPPGEDLLDSPLPDLTADELAAFARGDAEFGRAFAAAEGLGPIFNNVSCASCHSGDGRGRPENALVRFGTAPDFAAHLGGPQLQTRAIGGAVAEQLPAGVASSRRLPPPVFGMGLMEAIPDRTLLALADPEDRDRDGISGRAHMVTPPAWVPADEAGAGPAPIVGRFSRKAQVAGVLQQTVGAYHEDMGITSEFLPFENVNPLARASSLAADRAPDPEVSTAALRAVVHYVRTLAPPAYAEVTGTIARGRDLFVQAGCAKCHVPTLRTGAHRIAALSFKDVELYSDLLLHDLGPALSDGRADGGADAGEWRTAPLWGLRVMRDFLNGEAFLMHDGRARSVEEAILLHAGEASAARAWFQALAGPDQDALVQFVETR